MTWLFIADATLSLLEIVGSIPTGISIEGVSISPDTGGLLDESSNGSSSSSENKLSKSSIDSVFGFTGVGGSFFSSFCRSISLGFDKEGLSTSLGLEKRSSSSFSSISSNSSSSSSGSGSNSSTSSRFFWGTQPVFNLSKSFPRILHCSTKTGLLYVRICSSSNSQSFSGTV